MLQAYDAPGHFTVFPGYEIHSNAFGDYTIVYRDLDQREILKAHGPAELRSRLDAYYPGRAFAFPHHIGYRTGARGINWSAFDESLSPVVEMISMHGCSETDLGDRPFLHSMGAFVFGSLSSLPVFEVHQRRRRRAVRSGLVITERRSLASVSERPSAMSVDKSLK